MSDPVLYGIFAVTVTVLLAVDLFVVQRRTHTPSLREAGAWSAVWVGAAVLFGLVIVPLHGGSGAVAEYFSGYLIEKSLSVDNVLLWLVIFSALSVPSKVQHRVLFYGVLGAVVMRAVLIFTGAALIERFEFVLYVFGAFLLYAAWRTFRERGSEPDVSNSPVLQRVRRIVPATEDYRGDRFLVREDGRLLATPLFVTLILVEVTDLVFAVDSIPAIFGITRDPFIVLTSNVFAILGLRALYFLVAGLARRLRYLKHGLAAVLTFVGLKLLTEPIEAVPHPNPWQSLVIVAAILTLTVVASLWSGRVSDALRLPTLNPFRSKEEDERTERR